MIYTYRQFIEYFNLIGLSLPGLAVQQDGTGMVFWDPDRKLTRQRSITRYPVLEVQRPTLSLTLIDGGDQYRTFRAAFSVLEECQVDDEAGQEAVLDKLEAVMYQVIERMWYDELIENEIVEILPIRNAELDNLWGWGAEFQVKLEADLCFNSSEWLSAIQLQPDWIEGQTLLGLTINGQAFVVNWEAEDQLSDALSLLRESVNQSLVNASMQIMNKTVYIVSDNLGDVLTVSSSSGHAWTTLQEWP